MKTVSESLWLLQGDMLQPAMGEYPDGAAPDYPTGKYSLLLDDAELFYLSFPAPASISAGKLKALANTYLSTQLPASLVPAWNVTRVGGLAVITVFSRTLMEQFATRPALFKKAKRISTPLFELLASADTFDYATGAVCYRRAGDSLTQLPDCPQDAVTMTTILPDISQLKADLRIPGVHAELNTKKDLIFSLGIIAVSLLLFAGGEFLYTRTIVKEKEKATAQLAIAYADAGIPNTAADPYGMLLSKAEAVSGLKGRVLMIPLLNNLSVAAPAGVSVDSMSYRDHTLKLNGKATTFDLLEQFRKALEKAAGKPVTLDNSKKETDGTSFTLRFAP